MRQDLNSVVLVCPDNDAESRLILIMAFKLGMKVIRSGQGHGAKLEKERGGIIPLIQAVGGRQVWIVEMPGQDVERQLLDLRMEVIIIDHHAYGRLDRSRDSRGSKRPSSLSQFMKLLHIDRDAITRMGLDPVIVQGVSIMDARFVQGLREEGFSLEERRRVMAFIREYSMAGNPFFERAEIAAKDAWEKRVQWNDYIVVRSTAEVGIRGAVSAITIQEDCDTHPFILDDAGRGELFVQNVRPSVVERLMSAFENDCPFTFGTGNCWGVNNRDNGTHVTLQSIMEVLA
ncbi:hypothetical protein HZA87_03065 [Candidatus Uhrbacteria bacterium]|nr:hypothetical protein [Candidatus Uhrbacteria bacterium]